jgi:hypothetical protein
VLSDLTFVYLSVLRGLKKTLTTEDTEEHEGNHSVLTFVYLSVLGGLKKTLTTKDRKNTKENFRGDTAPAHRR